MTDGKASIQANSGVKSEGGETGQIVAAEAVKEDPMARSFSGLQSEDVEEFLEYVDQLLESNNWSQARAAAKVKARLMGAAATYVRVLKDVGLPLNKWSTTKPEDADRPDTLRQRLLVRFGKPITPVELCNMTRDLKMSDAESVQDFYYRALRIVQKKQIRLNPDILTGTEEFERVCENDHFILFVNGLPTAMREKVLGVQAPPEYCCTFAAFLICREKRQNLTHFSRQIAKNCEKSCFFICTKIQP